MDRERKYPEGLPQRASFSEGTGFFFARNQFARWGGVTVLGLNSIAQLMFIPAYPFWSLAIFALSIIIVYKLAEGPEGAVS